MAKNVKTMRVETVDSQHRYIEKQRNKKGFGVVFADAFLRGMRDIGYKSPSFALAEEIDNSVQAAAQTISFRFGYAPETKTHVKPDYIAIIDDGNGMIPEMISYAVRWGGTDREDNRAGFGRYGYGLPSSLISLARRYTVYSKVPGGQWHAVTVDVGQLVAATGDIEKTEAILSARPASLPEWVIEAEDKIDLRSADSGTVIVLEDIDRLRNEPGWKKKETIQAKLLQDFGVIYRYWLPERHLFVDGAEAQAVDPLFLMEHARVFEETPVRAERIATRTFEVDTPDGKKGTVTIRAAVLPLNFQLADPDDYDGGDLRGKKRNKRFPIMRAYNGLLICRERRQIDCIIPPFTKFQNMDLYVRIEIDFDAELDEFFGITTAKQQITIVPEMWEKLLHSGKEGGGLRDLIRDMRRRRDEIREQLDAAARKKEFVVKPRPSTAAMEESAKFKGRTTEPTPAQKQEANKNLEHEAASLSKRAGISKNEALKQITLKAAKRKWEVDFQAIPEGPFYRPRRLGEQKVVIVNTEHPFYTKIYNTNPTAQAGLEVMLFVLAERELEVTDDAEIFYKAERQRWSERLRHALNVLVADQTLEDHKSAVAERLYVAEDEQDSPEEKPQKATA